MTPIDITSRIQVSKVLKQLRLERGLSLGQLAIRCRVSSSTICYRERGERALSIEPFVRAVNALGYRLVLTPTGATKHHGARHTGTGWPT